MNSRLLSFRCRINHEKLPPKSQIGLFEMVHEAVRIRLHQRQQCKLRGVKLVKARRPYVQSLVVKCNATSDDVPLFSEVEMIEPVQIFLNQFMKLQWDV
uniref:Uncharacterized protein n=1 Tax=Solanum lycopersicum TaxID=4081 RepID=A0A3Q7IBM3_SOLLC